MSNTNSQKNGGWILKCSWRLSSSWTTSGTRRVTLLKNPVISHESKVNYKMALFVEGLEQDIKTINRGIKYFILCQPMKIWYQLIYITDNWWQTCTMCWWHFITNIWPAVIRNKTFSILNEHGFAILLIYILQCIS